MPINNINTLQNYEDLKYTTDLAKQDPSGALNTDYYIHALANLEQRTEYRYSNGIKYGILTYDKPVIVGASDVTTDNTLLNDGIAATTTLLELNNDMSFDITVNNIETYLKHSQIYDDGISFKSLLFGKILGTDNTPETNNVEIQYTDIDLNNHIIKEAYRVFYLDDPTNDNIYILIHLKLNDKNVNENTYKLTVYKLTIPVTNTTIKKIFRATTYAETSRDTIDHIFGNNVTMTVGSTEMFTELISSCSVYSTETIENNYTLDCRYDTIDEQLLKITDASMMSDSYNKVNELLYFNYYNINQYVRALNNDITVTYPNVLKYYSNRQFNSNNATLKDMIAKSLYNEIYNGLTEKQKRSASLEIPANTTITYVSNVENSLQIYYTDDIYVYFINNSAVNVSTNKNVTGIKFYYSGIDKTIIYNLYTKYNTKYTELVDCFKVHKKYVLPYIDDSHLWNINDNQTTIYASGESAGNPNIFLIRTYLDETSNNIIHAQLNRTDIQQNLLTYDNKLHTIKYCNRSTGAEQDYTYVFSVPVINSKSIDKLKYATLFIMSNVVIAGKEGNDYKYEIGPSITTIWTINDNSISNHSEFVIVTNNGELDGKPVTFEDMFGIDELIYRRFAAYGHNANVFDGMIALKLPKNQLNGSEPMSAFSYFSIERNSELRQHNTDEYDESAYNYNLVEMKINNSLEFHDFSYASNTFYTGDKKLINTWYTNGHKTRSPYVTGSISLITYKDTSHPEDNATVADIYHAHHAPKIGITSQTIEQSAASQSEAGHGSISNDVVGSFDETVINKYYDILNAVNTYKLPEYLPVGYVPILKESNILHQDNNIINRTNIYSFNKSDGVNNKINYAYIGTSCTDEDKSTLHIGTTDFTYMINLGKESLISSAKGDSDEIFQKTTKLALDIEQTDINSLRTNISYLMTEHNISVHTYDTDAYSSPIKVITIPINHIYNKYNGNSLLVTNIRSVNNNVESDVKLSELKASIRFTHIKIANIVDVTVDSHTEHRSALGIYINEKYPGLKENGIIDDLSRTFVSEVSEDPVFIPVSGYYNSTTKMLFFDTPLLINITIYNNDTQIYI